MKIAYFTESLPPLIDGVTRTLTRLAGTLESEGIDFRFYSPVKPDDSISWNHRVRKSIPSSFRCTAITGSVCPISGFGS